MKTKRLSTALLLAVVLGIAAFGVVKMRSTGADVSTQVAPEATPDTGPSESVFGEHSYTLPDYYEFAPPPEELPPPAISREEIIAKVQRSDADPIASVDLVTVVKSPLQYPPITGRQWLVVWTGVVSGNPLGLGGPAPVPGSPCSKPPEEQPPSCRRTQLYQVTALTLYDAETGELTTHSSSGTPLPYEDEAPGQDAP